MLFKRYKFKQSIFISFEIFFIVFAHQNMLIDSCNQKTDIMNQQQTSNTCLEKKMPIHEIYFILMIIWLVSKDKSNMIRCTHFEHLDRFISAYKVYLWGMFVRRRLVLLLLQSQVLLRFSIIPFQKRN